CWPRRARRNAKPSGSRRRGLAGRRRRPRGSRRRAMAPVPIPISRKRPRRRCRKATLKWWKCPISPSESKFYGQVPWTLYFTGSLAGKLMKTNEVDKGGGNSKPSGKLEFVKWKNAGRRNE